MRNMGLDYGLESRTRCFPQKSRWLFRIPDVSASGTNALPPNRANRPSLSFKEIEVQHLNETVFLPGKPDWKPINLNLYDIGNKTSPVFQWLQTLYNPETGDYLTPSVGGNNSFIREARLEMLAGNGDLLEQWIFENCWAQSIDFGDLDMANADIVTCDLVLRYARAYWQSG